MAWAIYVYRDDLVREAGGHVASCGAAPNPESPESPIVKPPTIIVTPDGISFFEGGFEETYDEWTPGRVQVTPDRAFTPTPEGSPASRDRSRSPRGSVEDLLADF